MLFNKKKDHSEEKHEIVHLYKSKYNRHERELRDQFLNVLRPSSSSTKIQFKKIIIDSRIEEYDELSASLICGLFFQLSQKLEHTSTLCGCLKIKAIGDDVEVEISHIQNQMLINIENTQFKTGFGIWGVVGGDSPRLFAKFSKSLYLKQIENSKVENSARRGDYV